MEPITFGIVGGGWRAEGFLRVSDELPERFKVSGVMVRDAGRGDMLERTWGVPTYRTLDDLFTGAQPLFVLVSVSKDAAPVLLQELADRRVPALVETPPAPDLQGLHHLCRLTANGARIQVAEQYAFQPAHAARLAVARSGKLGVVSQVQVSVIQDYHNISLIRKLLGVEFETARITAQRFVSPIMAGPDRQGPPREERIVEVTQTIAYLDFGDKLGVYDYAGDQHRSWIRSPRVLVRGDRGEINTTRVRYLQDFATPIMLDMLRQDAGEDGNMEGYHHQGILLGDEWIYRNPFAPGRLSDDEIAMATCLANMADYARGGPSFYSVAEAAQDHYLGLMMQQSLVAGESIRTTPQMWGQTTT